MGPPVDELRARACRLRPEDRLVELGDAYAFLEDRGMLTLTPSCSLPSLFGACHEEPHSPGKRGYGQYPKTRWWWGGALEQHDGALATKLLRGGTLFLASRVVGLVDPLCRAELARAADGAHGDLVARVVAHLRTAGPSTSDDLRRELGFTAAELQKARTAMETYGVALGRHEEVEARNGGHRHVVRLSLWDGAGPHPASHSAETALRRLLVAGVRAAVVVPEREARRWFAWKIDQVLVDDTVARGELRRTPDGRLACTSPA